MNSEQLTKYWIESSDRDYESMILTQNVDLRIEPHPIKTIDFEEGNPFIEEIKSTGLKVA